ncbi:MAG TPA: HEAT repeat domain-containing protein, partial [Opitutaceae bacterium]|nr:HEAT repeat domain-containing protein [Opitutaceae bacterium]
IAAGVLYHDGWVYATIAPDLWRFKDTDDDGVADIREIVVHGFGIHLAYAGHDMHGLSVGPDGRIYWSIGDKGLNVLSKEGRRFYYPNEGAVMRIEPDGSGFEVYAHGLRNPQEPAFDEWGDLFAVDNDADMKGERERFVYIMEGSDTGWRCNFQYMAEASPWMVEGYWKPPFPGQPGHLLPAIENYSDGPAGFRFDPGTALSERQRGRFLLNEFPSGKMKAFRAEPEGASFRMVDAEIVHEGVMGIGMSWHPDGSLMIVDWIGGYPLDGLGALWKVDSTDSGDHSARQETQRLISEGFESRTTSNLVQLLAHADQRVRQGAQFALVKNGGADALLAEAKRQDASLLARVHGIWGYGQLLRQGRVSVESVAGLLEDSQVEVRRQVLRILGDVPVSAAQGPAVIRLLSDPSPSVRVQAALTLGKWKIEGAVPALLVFTEESGMDVTLRHAAVLGLAGCGKAEDLGRLSKSPSAVIRHAAILALRRQAAPQVARFLSDADPALVGEAVRAIHDDLGIPDALPTVAAMLTARMIEDDTILRRVVNANLRVGTSEAAQRLLSFVLDSRYPQAARVAALHALKVWNSPPRLDLVDGYARTFSPAAVANVLTPRLDELLSLSDARLKTLAIEVMIAHSLRATPEQTGKIVADTSSPGGLRAQALRLMAASYRTDSAFQSAMDAALSQGSPAELHRTAMELLVTEQGGRLVREARKVLQDRSLAERQHTLTLLAQAKQADADQILLEMGKGLAAAKADPALALDLVEALTARAGSNAAFEPLLRGYAQSSAGQKQTELLQGGDAEAGQGIVNTHLNANCLACHSFSPQGGSEVGPNLRLIGSERSVEYLAEALMNPSASIATGYGLVTAVLKDDSTVSGTIAKETQDAVTVRQFDGTLQTLSRAAIKDLSAPVSIMPSMAGILQPREVRDVIAYLASLKRKPAAAPTAKREE